MEIFIKNTEHAVHTFYQGVDAEERQHAHQWLLNQQNSPDSLNISWLLLSSSHAVEVQHYGANMLYASLSRTTSPMDSTISNEINSQFLRTLCSFATARKMIYSKLCQSYAIFLLKYASTAKMFSLQLHIDEIVNVFEAEKLNPQYTILELLTVLPREYKVLCSNQILGIKSIFTDYKANLLTVSQQVLSNEKDLNSQCQILACFSNWIEVGLSLYNVSELFRPLLSKLSIDSPISKNVIEFFIEIVTAPTSYNYQNTVVSFLRQCETILEENLIQAFSRNNIESLYNFSLLFTSIGDAHCTTLLKSADGGKRLTASKLMQLILKFTSAKGCYPKEETYSELTFGFWYTLLEDSLLFDQKQSHEKLVAVLNNLIDIFVCKCTYPSEIVFSTYSAEDKACFNDYRLDIQDIMCHIYTVLQEKSLKIIMEKLDSISSSKQCFGWQQFESILFIFQSVCDCISVDEHDFTTRILSSFNHYQDQPVVVNTMMSCFGSLANWLKCHPDQMTHVMPFLIKGISLKDTCVTSCLALKNICHCCSVVFDDDTKLALLSMCHDCLRAKTSLKLAGTLLEVAAYIISVLPVQPMKKQLEALLSVIESWIEGFVKLHPLPIRGKSKKLFRYLNLYFDLFCALELYEEHTVHPITYVFRQFMSLVLQINRWLCFEEVTLTVTKCITIAVENCRENLLEFIPSTADFLAKLFLSQPHACLLDTSAIVICMFWSESQFLNDPLRSLFVVLLDSCLDKFESGLLASHPDVMQSFIDLMTRLMKTAPDLAFRDLPRHELVFNVGMKLLRSAEYTTVKSASDFFVAGVKVTAVFERSKEVIVHFGFDLMKVCMICIAGQAHEEYAKNIADIIFEFSKYFPSLLQSHLRELLRHSDFPSPFLSQFQKEQFIKSITRERANRRVVREAIQQFAGFCRK